MQKVLSHTMNKETRDFDDTRSVGDRDGANAQRWDLSNKQNGIKPTLSLRTRLREQKDKVRSSGGKPRLILLSMVPRS